MLLALIAAAAIFLGDGFDVVMTVGDTHTHVQAHAHVNTHVQARACAHVVHETDHLHTDSNYMYLGPPLTKEGGASSGTTYTSYVHVSVYASLHSGRWIRTCTCVSMCVHIVLPSARWAVLRS